MSDLIQSQEDTRPAVADGVLLRRSRPLLPMRCVMALLDIPEMKVEALIETGRLLWAWNVSLGASRRCLRVWYVSVIAYLQGTGQPTASEREILNSLFPHAALTLTAPEVERLLSVGNDHVRALIKRRALQCLNHPSPGPTGVAKISRASVWEFLKGRRVC